MWTRKTPSQRVAVIRRRKNLSTHMRRLIQQLNRVREAQVSTRKERKRFKTEHRDVLKHERVLATKLNKYRAQERHLVSRIDSEGTDAPYLTFDGFWSDESDEDAEGEMRA